MVIESLKSFTEVLAFNWVYDKTSLPKIMNFRHLLSCDTIDILFSFVPYSFLAGVESGDQFLLSSQVLSCFPGVMLSIRSSLLKSVQSALSDLLTTSATHGTFSRPSTKHGLILIGLELNTNARESFEHC